MNLINTDIKPDPFDPHRGDVYESGGPFPQRIVVEIPPTSEDQRIRYRVDGGADSNLTTLGQFHLHLAGLGEIRGVGRVREYSPVSPDEIRSLVHRLRSTALGVDDVAGELMRGAAAETRDGLLEAERKIRKEPLAYNDSTEPLAVARRITDVVAGQQSAGEILINTAWRLSVLIDAVVGSGAKDPRSDADLIRIATNARQVSDQVRVAVRLLGFEWDDSKADAGHALVEAVRSERKFASDLALELDSISAFIAPHGVATSAGAAKPRSLELVRWLAVTGGVVPHACHPTLAEVQEAQEVDFKARWDRYESAKRKPGVHEPARPEFGEVDHFPSVAETRALGLRAEVHRAAAQLREISADSSWPIRERLQSAAAVMLAALDHNNTTQIIDFVWPRLERVAGKRLERDLINAATLCTFLPGGVNADRTESISNPIFCTGFVTILVVKDRQIVQRQSWTSDRPGFKPTDVSFHDDDARFTATEGMGQRALELGDRQGTWTWRGAMGSFPDKQQWQGEWTEETP